ncbi:MAG: shikimate dehydrogenase [Alphaproteobacteria bacterium]|nr:shikimate dehydrogenase [Alphaproteobacteria bacterium]
MRPTGAARVAGVIGWPVAHSRSPRMHGYWLDRYGIDGAYVPLPVEPGRLADALRALPLLGMRGANVTIPHKEAAFAAVDSRSAAAERTGSVNLIVVREDGSLHGDSTDGYGFMENLRESLPGGTQDWQLRQAHAVILGAGGSAAAVAAALIDAGVPQVRLVARSLDRARALASKLGEPTTVTPWSNAAEALAEARLLVNATPLGMNGQPPLDIDLAPMLARAIVADLVYVPMRTELLARAQASGRAAIGGLGMLIHQARPAFKAWFGVDPEVTPELRAQLVETLA